MKKQGKLNSRMRDIIRVLHSRGGAMTAHEISKATGISYVTVRKYLARLFRMGVVYPIKGKWRRKE